MDVEKATLVWEAVGAVGSIAGAAVSAGAAVFAVLLAQRERRDRLDERDDRIKAETRLEAARQEAEREAREAQARRIVVRVWPSYDPEKPHEAFAETDPATGDDAALWRYVVRNTSDAPVRNVRLDVSPKSEPTLVDQKLVAVLLEPDKKVDSRTGVPRAAIVGAQAMYHLSFTDAAGRRWSIDQDGELRESP